MSNKLPEMNATLVELYARQLMGNEAFEKHAKVAATVAKYWGNLLPTEDDNGEDAKTLPRAE